MDSVLREAIDETDMNSIIALQDVYDKLFSIPPLAVRCELVRIKPFSPVECFGNWMPQVKKFMSDYCAEQEYMFTGIETLL